MAKFKAIISDPATTKVTVIDLEGPKAQPLIGRGIGDIVDGSVFGLGGQQVRITGGCDKHGIPMRADVHGGGKKHVVLAGGVGFKPQSEGERRRKLVRGKIITDETFQINCVISRGETKTVEAKPVIQEVKA